MNIHEDLDEDDIRDEGLPGLPLSVVAAFGLVITAPLWVPVCIVFHAGRYAVAWARGFRRG